jgi:hypothetical protein
MADQAMWVALGAFEPQRRSRPVEVGELVDAPGGQQRRELVERGQLRRRRLVVRLPLDECVVPAVGVVNARAIVVEEVVRLRDPAPGKSRASP